MSEQETKQEDQEFPVDPQADAMYAAAVQFFTDLHVSAMEHKADQAALDYIDQQKNNMKKFRKEDPMLSDLLREAQESLEEAGPHDDLEETFTGWVGELRDRRRKDAHHVIISIQGDGCGGCEGCS